MEGIKTKMNGGDRETGIEWGQGRQRKTVSPGALAGFMKSPRPESELCPCPTLWPFCAPG